MDYRQLCKHACSVCNRSRYSSKSHNIYQLFETVQKAQNLKVFSLKRINTVRWSSREFSLKVFFLRYDCIMKILKKVEEDQSNSAHARATAEAIRLSFETKQVLATAYLFRNVFAITGPLSRYLQSVNVDLGKAMGMIDSALQQLQRLRDEPDKVIQMTESA